MTSRQQGAAVIALELGGGWALITAVAALTWGWGWLAALPLLSCAILAGRASQHLLLLQSRKDLRRLEQQVGLLSDALLHQEKVLPPSVDSRGRDPAVCARHLPSPDGGALPRKRQCPPTRRARR